jgi:hypothetical protein
LRKLFSPVFCLMMMLLLPLPAWSEAAAGPAGKAVLILSGVQFGLPTSDIIVGGAVAALQEKGFSVNNIYVARWKMSM